MILRTILCLSLGIASYAQAKLEVGTSSPSVSLEHLDGSYADVTSRDSHQTYTVIEFSAAGCGACKVNVPRLKRLNNRLGANTKLRMVLINNKAKAQKFASDYNITFPVAVDSAFKAKRLFDIEYTPTLYVVGNNEILYSHVGVLYESDITDILNITRG